ncbi:MAG TPA: sugar transferase [Allosphingosinicella sp.]|nr:sugar transferase [Allosphingosinicella sp.]
MKRTFDVLVSAGMLMLLTPLILFVALLTRLFIGSPALFRQQRPGLRGRPFDIVKFRTMTDARDAEGALLPDADRLPAFGRFLRSTSLDELPELWNVLKGDMSLVGPRPLLMSYLPLYSKEEMRRHDVRPGLTGWAQVKGRNDLSWPRKFELDLWYVDHRTFTLDVRILLMTVWKVVRREGISQEGEATMAPFSGSGGREG